MAFILKNGRSVFEWYPKVASTAFSVGAAVKPDGSGNVTPVAADNTTNNVVGICMKKVASTDSDYASNTLIPIQKVGYDQIFLADVGAGTASASNVGLQYDFTDSLTVDLGATDHKNVTV